MQLSQLRVIVFPGGFNWPLWVAQDKGLFAARGLAVELVHTPNSVVQMSGLISGEFDIAMTAMDNVVAYDEGQGESGSTAPADLVAVLGADKGFLRVVASPDIGSMAQLKGRTLAVDALTTGYAFVLRELLARHGVAETECEFVKAGGVMQRFEGLVQKRFDATLLVAPFDLQAAAAGFRVLANASCELGNYQGVVAAVRREWAGLNEVALASFIRAYREALAWLDAPASKSEAIELLRRHLPNLDEKAATAIHRVLLDPEEGFTRDARPSVEGIRTVLELRGRYGAGAGKLDDMNRYLDLRYYEMSLKS